MSKDSQAKPNIHARNKNKTNYDFEALKKANPKLEPFVQPNKVGNLSIDFADAKAVKSLNQSILKYYYGVDFWDIPEGYLCPPIPGRADYIHHIADLLMHSNFGNLPKGKQIKCVDIGTGANCIYPVIGSVEYDWSFIGSDIDLTAIESAKKIAAQNSKIKDNISLFLQPDSKDFFYNVIDRDEKFDISICNPPFHNSAEEANAGSKRKNKNLTGATKKKADLNFGGQSNELWCEGGELKFINNLMKQSKKYGKNCYWFTSLVSKQSHLKSLSLSLKSLHAVEIKEIPMGQGNKSSRILAWTFLNKQEQKEWKLSRWK